MLTNPRDETQVKGWGCNSSLQDGKLVIGFWKLCVFGVFANVNFDQEEEQETSVNYNNILF